MAAKNPEAIIKQRIDVRKGLSETEAREFAEKLGFEGKT